MDHSGIRITYQLPPAVPIQSLSAKVVELLALEVHRMVETLRLMVLHMVTAVKQGQAMGAKAGH